MSLAEEFVKIESLKPYARSVNVKGKVLKVGEARVVSQGEHRVADALIGDETGCIFLTLWDDDVVKYAEGDVVQINNGHVSVFRGSMRLSAGKYGTAKKIDETIPTVNTENNLSDKVIEERREYGRGYGQRSYERRGYERRGYEQRGYGRRRFSRKYRSRER
jgi:replication factor A1